MVKIPDSISDFIESQGICVLENGCEDYYWKGCMKDGLLDDHPPPEKRRKKLRKHMMEKYGQNPVDL